MDQRRELHASGHSAERVFLHPQRRPVPPDQGRVQDGTGTHKLQHPGACPIQRGAQCCGTTTFVEGYYQRKCAIRPNKTKHTKVLF